MEPITLTDIVISLFALAVFILMLRSDAITEDKTYKDPLGILIYIIVAIPVLAFVVYFIGYTVDIFSQFS